MKIVVATDDRVGPRMAGSALRAWEIARVLAAAGHTIRLAAAEGSSSPGVEGPAPEIRIEHGWADAVISPPWSLPLSSFAASSLLVIDGTTPLLAELAAQPDSARVRWRRRTATARLPLVSSRADAILVASEDQARWWQAHVGRAVPMLKLPFGVPEPPPREQSAVPGVPDDWSVALWWGGVWPWLDLETLLAARRLLGEERLSLVIPTAQRPGGSASSFSPSMLADAASRHGLSSPQVVGLDTWIPYADRHRLLNSTSVLAVLHHPGQEAELSFRTRALDGVWAGVPLLLSEGGEAARLARTHGWGEVVTPHAPDEAAAALKRLLNASRQEQCRAALAQSVGAWRWSRLAEPLLNWLAAPQRSKRLSCAAATLRAGWRLLAPRSESPTP